jgi:hypothetical protein
MVRISTKNELFQDLKTGGMRLDILEARQAKSKRVERSTCRWGFAGRI